MKRAHLISLLVLVLNVIICAYYYNQLPETIPIHFNFQGDVDGHGSKSSLFGIPGIGLFIFLMLYGISKQVLTRKNTNPKEIKLMNWTAIGCQCLFLMGSLSVLSLIVYENNLLSKAMTPIIFILVIILLFYSFKIKTEDGGKLY